MNSAVEAPQANASADLEKFRAELRGWLEQNCPAEMRRPVTSEADICWGGRRPKFQSDAQRLWLERMAARGFTVPDWRRGYGGAGLSRAEARIFREETARLGCRPPLTSFGIWMLGPALMKYGSEAQKQKYLPEIARGEIRWCQGYSEPNAGSDLASLATKAEDKGNHLLVNGQKIWTSYADQADWIFCLVRTDPAAEKHKGISFLLFDMESPGVSTRPITLISGKSPFCETFFENVKVPKENLVGEINQGWEIAKYLLTHERASIGGFGAGQAGRSLGELACQTIGSENGILADPLLRAKIAEFEVDGWCFLLAMERAADLAKTGQGVGAYSSVLKYYGAELNKRRFELMMDAGGSDALEWEGARSQDGKVAREWLRSKANSIEGGTSEIQLNIIAKRLLELPGA
jgi:acyl-CoA dehydrogenase